MAIPDIMSYLPAPGKSPPLFIRAIKIRSEGLEQYGSPAPATPQPRTNMRNRSSPKLTKLETTEASSGVLQQWWKNVKNCDPEAVVQQAQDPADLLAGVTETVELYVAPHLSLITSRQV